MGNKANQYWVRSMRQRMRRIALQKKNAKLLIKNADGETNSNLDVGGTDENNKAEAVYEDVVDLFPKEEFTIELITKPDLSFLNQSEDWPEENFESPIEISVINNLSKVNQSEDSDQCIGKAERSSNFDSEPRDANLKSNLSKLHNFDFGWEVKYKNVYILSHDEDFYSEEYEEIMPAFEEQKQTAQTIRIDSIDNLSDPVGLKNSQDNNNLQFIDAEIEIDDSVYNNDNNCSELPYYSIEKVTKGVTNSFTQKFNNFGFQNCTKSRSIDNNLGKRSRSYEICEVPVKIKKTEAQKSTTSETGTPDSVSNFSKPVASVLRKGNLSTESQKDFKARGQRPSYLSGIFDKLHLMFDDHGPSCLGLFRDLRLFCDENDNTKMFWQCQKCLKTFCIWSESKSQNESGVSVEIKSKTAPLTSSALNNVNSGDLSIFKSATTAKK